MSEKHSGVAPQGVSQPGKPPRITVREQEILSLIAAGLPDQEIAERLWISLSTVHTHHALSGDALADGDRLRRPNAGRRDADRRGGFRAS